MLAAHLAVILFNVFGLIAIPLGAARGWAWVRIRWWRALHVAALGIVALQALLGRACFLTVWQSELAGGGQAPAPLVMRWINQLIFWPLPIWAFALLYLAVFGSVLALWRLVPPRPARGDAYGPRSR